MRVWVTSPDDISAEVVLHFLREGCQVKALSRSNNPVIVASSSSVVSLSISRGDEDASATSDGLGEHLTNVGIEYYSVLVTSDNGGSAWMAGNRGALGLPEADEPEGPPAGETTKNADEPKEASLFDHLRA
jgi:hypothetical protein